MTILSRRRVLQCFALMGAVVALPRTLFAARPDNAFAANKADDVISDLFGGVKATTSDAVKLKIPDIAENGAVVPVTVSTTLPNAETLVVIVDNNPTPLAGLFELTERVSPNVSLRIKMGQSSNVRGLVKAGGKLYVAEKEVKVTIGGCGG